MKKKVLFCIWSFSYGGGAERILTNIVNRFPSDQYEVDVWEFYRANVHTFEVNPQVNLLEAVVSKEDHPMKIRFYNYLAMFAPKMIRKKHITKEYDIEVAFNYQIPSFLLDYSKKTLCWAHGDVYNLQNDRLHRQYQLHYWRQADRLIGISNNTVASMVEVFPTLEEKVIKIYNGYDLAQTKQKAAEATTLVLEPESVCFIGRLDENKNVSFMIQAVHQLHMQGKKIHAYIIGKGELEDALKGEAQALGIASYVHFLGFQSNPFPLLKQTKVNVLTSKQEGMPTVLAEGMALGIPFVSTPVGGVQELSDHHRCGFIASDVTSFARSIQRLFDDETLYEQMAAHALQHVQVFSLERQMETILQLMETI